MMKHCPYFIGALLLIYLDSTHQALYEDDIREISELLREENSGKFPTFIRQFVIITFTRPRYSSNIPEFNLSSFCQSGRDDSSDHIECGKLSEDEKESLCDEEMDFLVFLDHGIRDAPDTYFETMTRFPVPRLVNLQKPSTCEKISIEGLDMERCMFWCKHRVYKDNYGKEIRVEGIFISLSHKDADTAFIFRPSKTNDGAVIPVVVTL